MKKRMMHGFRRLPIKWKLMLGATLLIFLLFVSYNFAQYLVLKNWMLNQEKSAIQVTMVQIQDYLAVKTKGAETLTLAETRTYMEKIVGKNQMIRFVNAQGIPLFSVTNHFKGEWVLPQHSNIGQVQDITHGEDHLLIYRTPIATAQWSGTIEVATNLETFDHFNRTLFWVMIVGGLLAVLISGISGLSIAKQFMQPIRALGSAIRSVKQKGLTERVANIENGDELSSLANLFNDLMDQLEGSFRQQKQFVEDASHELRTPITILEGHLSMLNRWGKTDPLVLQESLTASLQEVRRLKGLVQELLTLTKVESQPLDDDLESIQIEPILRDTISRVEALHPDFNFEVEATSLGHAYVRMIAMHVEQILLIVLDNAVKYSANWKRISVKALPTENDLKIIVRDYGIGISQDDIPYVFDRFYRVDKARNREIGGTGLGLSIAKQLVRINHGEISISSIENEGTTVTIMLPIVNNYL
ncbi:ATP-binding protein [Paenibacillus sp. SI8]|uniref:HAMP domain-containing sensor histidine kinase n=1 Tax=unclassified Paenibacillus TaxID=185978 RepID=UPI003464F4C0